jgi:hypothetical protein
VTEDVVVVDTVVVATSLELVVPQS